MDFVQILICKSLIVKGGGSRREPHELYDGNCSRWRRACSDTLLWLVLNEGEEIEMDGGKLGGRDRHG